MATGRHFRLGFPPLHGPRRRSFESVQLRNEAAKCVRDLRGMGYEFSRHFIMAYWRDIDRSYRQNSCRWLDRCRFARLRAAPDAGAVGE